MNDAVLTMIKTYGPIKDPLDQVTVIDLLDARFRQVDFDKAKEDVAPFISVERRIDLLDWSHELFCVVARSLKVET